MWLVFQQLLQFLHGRMQPQLKDCEDAPLVFLFKLLELIQVPWIDHQGFFANRVSAHAERKSHVGVVQVVRRANRDVIDRRCVGISPLLLQESIETFDFREEPRLGEVAVQETDGIVRINSGYEHIPGIVNGFQVLRRNVAANTN
jgi:hypothetical protein